MNRFPDTFQTVTDRNLFGPNVPYGMNTMTRWLTNSGWIAQALISLTHSSIARQTIMSAMFLQLQSELCPPQHCPLLPKLDILVVDANENSNRNGKLKTTSRADHWTHMRSKLLVKRNYINCGTWRCTSTPPKQRHGHEQDATLLASSGSIPTTEVPKLHVTARVWCVQRCTTKGLNRSSRQHLRWKLFEFYHVCVSGRRFSS